MGSVAIRRLIRRFRSVIETAAVDLHRTTRSTCSFILVNVPDSLPSAPTSIAFESKANGTLFVCCRWLCFAFFLLLFLGQEQWQTKASQRDDGIRAVTPSFIHGAVGQQRRLRNEHEREEEEEGGGGGGGGGPVSEANELHVAIDVGVTRARARTKRERRRKSFLIQSQPPPPCRRHFITYSRLNSSAAIVHFSASGHVSNAIRQHRKLRQPMTRAPVSIRPPPKWCLSFLAAS